MNVYYLPQRFGPLLIATSLSCSPAAQRAQAAPDPSGEGSGAPGAPSNVATAGSSAGGAGAAGASASTGAAGANLAGPDQPTPVPGRVDGFPASSAHSALSFEMIQVQNQFWSEGADMADLDGDGAVDVITGPWAFAGPDFKSKWQFREYDTGGDNFKDGQYDRFGMADSWAAYLYDVNGDGRPDPISKGHPGNGKLVWFENSGRREKFVARPMAEDIALEQNMFRDITGDGKPEFIAAKDGHMGYVRADWAAPQDAWTFQAVSENGPWGTNHNFYHGVGVGDMNADGRMDLLHNTGWDEQPQQATQGAWTHHDAASWPGHTTGVQFGGAHMFGFDVDGDGDTDMVTSVNSHGYGLAWWEQTGNDWKRHLIFGAPGEASEHPEITISQVHASVVADMDGDGLLDIVTGKSYWAHPDAEGTPPSEDVRGTPYLYVFRLVRKPGGAMFEPHLVGEKSGVGRQFSVGDVNGDGVLDIVVGNKLGTFVYTQRR